MPTETINLVKGDKTSIDTDYRDALPVNMYAVERPILGADGYMICYPGLTNYATGLGYDRGANYNDNFAEHYRVSGRNLIKIASDGTVTTLGAISGGLQASMPYSFITQAVITDGKMWLYSPTLGYGEVTDANLGSPIDGTWIDGYYFLTDGSNIYHTDITDETVIDPTQYSTANFSPDPTLGVAKTQDNKVIVFGRYTIEYFINVATDDFAFQRVETRAQKIGIVATHAKCEAGGGFYFTGSRKEEALGVYNLKIGEATKISSREVDKILATYTEPALTNMRMESRMEGGTVFILVHLPNETLCFNETVAKKFGIDVAWTLLKTDVTGDAPYRGINGIFESSRGQWVYGDKQSTDIGYLDNTVFTHYGSMVEWLLYTPILKLEGKTINSLEIETIPGHTTSQDAKVAISMTYDGLTYGNEWYTMYGAPLDYGNRFIINRLGGHIRDYVGIKLRGATTSRMAFATTRLTYG
jgi:hypothetical protein